MLAGPPSKPRTVLCDYEQQLALMGLVDQDAAQVVADRQPNQQASESTFDVWPDHDIPLLLFQTLLTQWRMGGGGPIGLDYEMLDSRPVRRLGLTDQQLDDACPAPQTMEAAGLDWFAEVREAAIAAAKKS